MKVYLKVIGCSPGLLVPRLDSGRSCEGNHGGQGGPRCSGGVESPWRSELTGVEVWLDSGDGMVRGRGSKLGEVPGAQAKLLRGSTVAQGTRRSGAMAARWISGLSCGLWKDGRRRKARVAFKEVAPGILGVCAPAWA